MNGTEIGTVKDGERRRTAIGIELAARDPILVVLNAIGLATIAPARAHLSDTAHALVLRLNGPTVGDTTTTGPRRLSQGSVIGESLL